MNWVITKQEGANAMCQITRSRDGMCDRVTEVQAYYSGRSLHVQGAERVVVVLFRRSNTIHT